jgi:hypothetical protein
LSSGREWLGLFLEFGEEVPAAFDRWRWLPEVRSYLYTPTYLPPAWRYRQYLLAWEEPHGWVLTIPDDGVRVWFPIFDKGDRRNRPDQFILAAMIVVEKYDNGGWTKLLSWLRDGTKEMIRRVL